jgi:hypothetical protein
MVEGGVRHEVTRWRERFTNATKECYAHITIAWKRNKIPQMSPHVPKIAPSQRTRVF